jgi:hypothetical protein
VIATTRAEVIERLPFEKYIELPAVHSSGLREMLVSPLHYQHRQQSPRTDSDTLRAGRAGHTAILEPERFLREYVEWVDEHEDGTKRVRRGKAWDEFQAINAGKTILKPAQFKTALTLRDVVRDHPVAGPLVKGIGRNELSIHWVHERTGLKCKARIDRITSQALIDIKTTRDPTPRSFAATAARLAYTMQLALYSDGAEAAGLGAPAVKIVAVQNVEPFDVVVYDLEFDELEHGRRLYEEAMDKVVECRKSQRWPGFAETSSIPLKLPAWAMPGADEADIVFGGDAIF